MSMHSELIDAFDKQLATLSTPSVVRTSESGGLDAALWAELEASGFLDALVAEEAGGAGLPMEGLSALFELGGRYLVPAPLAETIAARALLARAGAAAPEGPVLLVTAHGTGGALNARAVPFGRVAKWALVDTGTEVKLLPVEGARGEATGTLGCNLAWAPSAKAEAVIARPANGLRPLSAALRSCEIAGTLGSTLEMCVAYCGDRRQFGKPIAAFQAVQQQLAVAAEQILVAQMSAAIGCSGGLDVPVELAAISKQGTSAAAATVAAIAHGIHGAIGISAEYDLQLHTRRLYEARMADGSESYWAEKMAASRLESPAATTVDFLKTLPITAPVAG